MKKNTKKNDPIAVSHLHGFLLDIKPIRGQLDRLSRKYRTLANKADKAAMSYQRKLETLGCSVNALPDDEDPTWLLRFYNAYSLLSEIYSDISKALSLTHDPKGAVYLGSLPNHPSDFEVVARLATMKQQYAAYLDIKRVLRADRRPSQ